MRTVRLLLSRITCALGWPAKKPPAPRVNNPRRYPINCWRELGGCGEVSFSEEFEPVCPKCGKRGMMTPMAPMFF